MATMTQLNTRMDSELKRRGDAVFSRAGLTSSEVVRAVWRTAADTQQVPECVCGAQGPDKERERGIRAVREASHLFETFCKENSLPYPATRTGADHELLCDELYDALSMEMESRHA